MSEKRLCEKYLTHQFVCNHSDQVFRCHMKDGCVLDYCRDCILDKKSPFHGYDLINLTLLSPTLQLPPNRAEWSEEDVLINLLRLSKRY